MNFLFLFGLVFLSGCMHRNDIKNVDTKASKAEINKDEGGAFVTPSEDLKALRLQSHFSQDVTSKKESPCQVAISKEIIQARLTDIPVMIGAQLCDAQIDQKNNKYVRYTSVQSVDAISVFYADQLERFGWSIKTLYCDDLHGLLLAKKPHKSAVFLLEHTKGSWVTSSSTTITIVVSIF